ncbi:SH2/SH3 adapter protein NCK1-like [Montipora foliosa]|uniref:SH2/SH3 adapter protein NCK1-like n=1 Tax=Montipora foliosa TaxID=591990 RepID=UPI0035F0FD04
MSCMNAVAIYDYTATQSEELSIKKDEKLTIIDDSKTWWQVENSRRETGYVPSNYVKRANKGFLGKLKRPKEKDNPENGSLTQPPAGEYFVPKEVLGAVLETVIAKYAFQPQHNDELALKKGDKIKVIEKQEDGWWKGRIGNTEGWFPSNYIQPEDNSKSGKLTAKKAVLHKVRTLYNFDPKNPEELSFKKDEILDVIEKPDDDPEWWIARKQDGSCGLVPRNYIVIVDSDGETSATSSDSSSSQFIPPRKVILPEHRELPFSDEKWFWGNISRGHAEKMLNKGATDGDFLVRVSETQEGGYSVSMKAPDRIKHFRVKLENGTFNIGPRNFNSLHELIEHYKKAPIFTDSSGNKLFLVKPFDEGLM